MNENSATQKILFWTPRMLAILFTAFVSLFALDVFNEGYGFWETAAALVMHLLPCFAMVIVILIAWKWELAGGITFILLGFGYFMMAGLHRPISWYVTIAGPLFLTGVLFLLSRFLAGRKHA